MLNKFAHPTKIGTQCKIAMTSAEDSVSVVHVESRAGAAVLDALADVHGSTSSHIDHLFRPWKMSGVAVSNVESGM